MGSASATWLLISAAVHGVTSGGVNCCAATRDASPAFLTEMYSLQSLSQTSVSLGFGMRTVRPTDAQAPWHVGQSTDVRVGLRRYDFRHGTHTQVRFPIRCSNCS